VTTEEANPPWYRGILIKAIHENKALATHDHNPAFPQLSSTTHSSSSSSSSP